MITSYKRTGVNIVKMPLYYRLYTLVHAASSHDWRCQNDPGGFNTNAKILITCSEGELSVSSPASYITVLVHGRSVE